MLTLVLNVESTKAQLARMAPAMQTARHPYLLASADTTGPETSLVNIGKDASKA